MLRFAQGAQGLAAGQADAHFAGAVIGVEDLFDAPAQQVVPGQQWLVGRRQLQPARLDQRHHRGVEVQFQALGAVVGDLRVQRQAAGQLQFNQVVVAMAVDGLDAAVQLVAGAGSEHQAAQQVEVAGVFGGVQHLALQGLQALIEAHHPFPGHRQARTAATFAAHTAFNQRGLRQVVQLVDAVPRRFVADARAFGGAGDRALLGDVLQQGNALRAAGDVLGQQSR